MKGMIYLPNKMLTTFFRLFPYLFFISLSIKNRHNGKKKLTHGSMLWSKDLRNRSKYFLLIYKKYTEVTQ